MLPCAVVIGRPAGSPTRHPRWGALRGLGEASVVVLTATALAVVLTYPLAFQIGSLGRLNTDDGRWSIWVVSWVAHALTTNPLGVFDANIFYPHRSTLAFSEANIMAGAIGAPVWALTKNPYLTHNVVLLISFVVSYAGAYYLIRYLTRSRPAAVVAGVLYAFCPFIFARTAHIQLLMTGGLPFCMLAFHRLADRATVGRAVTLGILVWAQSLACAYYGVFAILMIGLGTFFFAIWRGLWRSRDYWLGIALAAVVSITVTLPFFMPYVRVQREMGFARTLNDARQYSADIGAWFASSAWAHRWWLPALGDYNEVLFPGFVTLAAGLAGAAWQFLPKRGQSPFPQELRTLPKDTAIFYLSIGIIALWLSFGPNAGLYWLFYKTIPIFTFMRAPGRFGILVVLSLVVLGAPLLASLLQRTRRPLVAAAVIAALAATELAAIPLTQFRPAEPLSPVYRLLATLPDAPVIELPFWYQRSDFPRHAYYMLNSTAHWKPLINGYSDHIPEDFRQRVIALSSFPSYDTLHLLAEVRARYVVFHLRLYDSRNRARLDERLDTYSAHLRPLLREGDVWLYEIVGVPE
jgi:hypothetical protein